MKKFLSVVSVLLVAFMMLAIVPVSADEASETAAFELPKNIRKYYANDITGTTPTIDGTISENEYGKLTVRVDNPSAMVGDTRVFMTEPADETLRSEYIDFYFAYDESNIYIAIYDSGFKKVDNGDEYTKNDVPFRYNYFFMMGFMLEDLLSDFRFGGGSTNSVWSNLRYHEFGKSNTPPIKTYDLVSECVVRKVDTDTGADVAFGDLLSANGNANYTDGSWEVYMEMKLDKKQIANAMNECFFTDYDEIPNAMYFDFTTNTYRAKADDLNDSVSQYYSWLGNNNVAGSQGDYADFGYYEGMKTEAIFDLIVFGDENTEIVPADPFPVRPETEPAATEPTTEAPVVDETEAPSENEATEAPVTEAPAADGGCGGAVSIAGIALVAALGTCTAFVAKKKKD